jgi:HJR/Mrr/RecB family endonuclease
LPKDGEQFEALVAQLLEAMGCRILEPPARGADFGRDILVERTLSDAMCERTKRVLIQVTMLIPEVQLCIPAER